jgi:hypothetical protein
MDCHDNDSWADLRVGEIGLMRGVLENVSPAETADSIVITFPDWAQMVLDVPEGEPVDVKHMEEERVSVTFRRTEDGCEAVAIWMQGGVPHMFSNAAQLTTVS